MREGVAQGQCGSARTFCFVAVRGRNTEHDEHIGARALIGTATERLRSVRHERVKLLGQGDRLLGVRQGFELEQPLQACNHHDGIAQGWVILGLHGRSAGRLRCNVLVRGFVVCDTGATAAHQVSIQRFGGGLRGDIELATQRIATDAVLAQRLGVGMTPRVQFHERAVRRFVQRFQRHQSHAGCERPFRIAVRGAQRRHPLQRFGHLTAKNQALVAQPFLERRRARIQTLEQLTLVTFDDRAHVSGRARSQRGAQREQIDLHDVRLERDRFGIRAQRGMRRLRQRLAKRGECLPQAGACKLFVGIFPEQRGQTVASLGFARTRGEIRQQRATLARGDPDFSTVRVENSKAA